MSYLDFRIDIAYDLLRVLNLAAGRCFCWIFLETVGTSERCPC